LSLGGAPERATPGVVRDASSQEICFVDGLRDALPGAGPASTSALASARPRQRGGATPVHGAPHHAQGRSADLDGLEVRLAELATRSDAFPSRWARHDVRLHRTARKRLHNAVFGALELTGDVLQMPGEDLTLIIHTAEAGSAAH
jgi:hypothetical protein